MASGTPTFAPQHDVARLLQGLVALNIDGARSFRQAAAQFTCVRLTRAFLNAADAHAAFAHELQVAVAELGETPTQAGTAAGDIYRSWMGLSGRIAEGDESLMLAEVERNERAVRRRYEEVMEQLRPVVLKLPPHETARTPRKVRGIEARILMDAGAALDTEVHAGPGDDLRGEVADPLNARVCSGSEAIQSLLERHHNDIRRMMDANSALRKTAAVA